MSGSCHGSTLEAHPNGKRLEGKVAIITGGASGIDESTARLFVRYGAKVVIADIQDHLGHSVCEDVTSTGGIISYIHCDVTKEVDVENLVDKTIEKYGKLDIMYNNAGIADKPYQSVLDLKYEEFKRVIDVNVIGSFLGAKHAARVMIPANKGSILFTASTASLIDSDTPNAYTTSKHAVVGLTKNLCVELGRYGIRVNCISPYGVATPLLTDSSGVEASKLEAALSQLAVLKGKVLKTEDVAEAAVFLASDESKYISGINLPVDGGFSTTSPTFGMALKAAASMQ